MDTNNNYILALTIKELGHIGGLTITEMQI